MTVKSVVLCILDGWGNGDESSVYNAISLVEKPCWNKINSIYPRSNLEASGKAVGVPDGQMGNSEIGHMTIGSGRIIEQGLQRINEEIDNIDQNNVFLDLVQRLKQKSGACHIMGLLSDGGVHSHQVHIFKLIEILAQHGIQVFVHVILDGRDAPPRSALGYLQQLQNCINTLKGVKIATISGRYYAMDRDNRIERTLRAYNAMFFADAPKRSDEISALNLSYELGISDEFVEPVVIDDYLGINPQDGLLIANFRADRVLQMIRVITGLPSWDYQRREIACVVGMTKYVEDFDLPYLFAPVSVSQSLAEVISARQLKQLRIAETEKYAHVTFFFNGGSNMLFAGEERIIVPSPQVETYDLKPEMSAFELTDLLVEQIKLKAFSLIVANFANADMVAHSGNIYATTQAIKVLDSCLAKVLDAVESVSETVLIVTADHGNAEQMFDAKTGMSHTAHTTNTVPFILCNYSKSVSLRDGGLADIAPTILSLLEIKQPKEMTGRSLIL